MSASDEVKRWLKRHWFDSLESSNASPIYRWELDYPSPDREAQFSPSGRLVQGWVLLSDAYLSRLQELRIVAQWDDTYELRYPLKVKRPDVIERILEEDATAHPQHECGYRFSVPFHLTNFKLWLELGDERWLLRSIDVDAGDVPALTTLKVLEGKEGWLFLDNDTNGSVDQYRGHMRLTEQGLRQWQGYLQGFQALVKKHGATAALLIAPSKESVMGPRYHPLPEGEGGPIYQLLALPEASKAVYPVADLTALGDSAFIRTDTHWAQQGAMVATKALAKALGLEPDAVDALFENDEYKTRQLVGDLGNKFSPERQCDIQALTSFNYVKFRHFDNGLPNFGRWLIMVNPDALASATCLIFGSSSSYSMLNYLCRLFSHVVFVHTAGNLDPELTGALQPDYLIVQTNARFVVQVPKAKQSLAALIEDKRARLSSDEQALVDKRKVLVDERDELVDSLGLSPWVAL
ncbi:MULTISPECIES: hypothetical protein [unclassified Halomonas]|uniref:alginate O-acetyltransferase AlgX-related protein n=1 Tax=unclassified Halomonas TaxID=2609666 RepID=UPI002076A49E|nr:MULTISPECIES: hypothetical protein [unclassified Halomonas]